MLAAGRELEGLETLHQQALAEGRVEPEPVEKAWRTFRALPRREGPWLRTRSGREAAG